MRALAKTLRTSGTKLKQAAPGFRANLFLRKETFAALWLLQLIL